MPKRIQVENKRKRDEFAGLIGKYMSIHNMSSAQLADAIGMHRNTWYSRRASPMDITWRESELICKALRIPKAEFAEVLGFVSARDKL